ncbi:MAG: hypothetical protein JWP34_4570 [Massilia sp.]|jgi:hypothetical protein|nr:hypothetical protein [Gemmatimonadales bacterium]MDB5910456.1 hypothetical protein [Massilia sp.]
MTTLYVLVGIGAAAAAVLTFFVKALRGIWRLVDAGRRLIKAVDEATAAIEQLTERITKLEARV